MHTQGTYLSFRSIGAALTALATVIAMVTIVMATPAVYGQAEQYKRAKKKASSPSPADAAVPVPKAGDGLKKDEKKDQKTEPTKDEKSDKVDISDLEQKYWAPKDVEFSVVQNRLYSKTRRFAVTPSVGPQINDSFSAGPVYGLTGNYYFSERSGVELNYSAYNLYNSKVQDGFVSSNGTSADFNRPQQYIGASYNWVPIYAKISLLEQKIMYFDMSISPGIGYMTYQQQEEGGTGHNISVPALSIDVAQHYFISKEFAFRLDMRNRIYQEQVVKYRSSGTVSRKGDVVSESTVHNITIQFGLTYYFGG